MASEAQGYRVLSLFDGMSCGQIALKKLGVNVSEYYASEVDKYAIKTTNHNFPNTIQLGDVRNLDVSKLGNIDILIGGSPCFGGNTFVLTKCGYKRIREISVGDEVLTHKNRYRKVLQIGNKFAKANILKIHGALDTITTENHPYYARKKEYLWVNELRTKKLNLSQPEWIEAGTLSDKYRVAHAICDIEENPLNITIDEAYVLGRYIADGHTRKDLRYDGSHNGIRYWQLILSIGKDKVATFKSNLPYSMYPHTQSTFRAVFSSKRLVQITEAYCGIGAENKYFSEMMVKLPKDILQSLFAGYLDGDGCYIKDKKSWSITTISEIMAVTIQRVISKLYGIIATVHLHKCAGVSIICGREVNVRNQYCIRFFPNSNGVMKQESDGRHIWVNPKSFVDVGDTIVYNLEVEEDNSYTANGIVVHNCQNFSFAGKRNGMTTTDNIEIITLEQYLKLKSEGFEFDGQSYLFWEYVRILKELKPKYFLLENVIMAKEWEVIISRTLGIAPIRINSALVSAQNRDRLYWTNINAQPHGLFGELTCMIPQPKDRWLVLADILESDVAEKYYLSDKMLSYLINNSSKMRSAGHGFKFTPTNGNVKAKTVTSKEGNRMDDNFIVAMHGRNSENRTVQQLESRTDNKTNCLATVSKDNLIINRQVVQLNQSTESNGCQPFQGRRVYDCNGLHPALMSEQRGYVTTPNQINTLQIPEATKKGCIEIKDGQCFDAEQPNSKTRRGRAMIEKSNALLTQNAFRRYQNVRIRRLTPAECKRLQTIPDWYDMTVVSETQQYRMLGNGWTVDVIAHILSYLP